MDAAWLLRQWCLARVNPLEILTERENIYKLLSQTSDGPGNVKEAYKSFTIKPATRYKDVPQEDRSREDPQSLRHRCPGGV